MSIVLEDTPAGILWDLDNTLYRVNSVMEKSFFNTAVAHAVREWGLDLSLDIAIAMAHESFEKTRFSARVFVDQYNIPFQDLHFLIDKHLDHKTINACDDTRRLFQMCPVDHALITHAARRWGLTVLNHLGLSDFFPEDRVFGFETYEFQSKANSPKSFEMALAAMNKNPDQSIMVEDTVENLRVPHDMGMTTILVHHGKVPDMLPDFVDHVCTNARDVMAAVYSSASG